MKVVKKYVYNDNESEKELVKKFLAGKNEAFNPLFYRYKAIFFSNVKNGTQIPIKMMRFKTCLWSFWAVLLLSYISMTHKKPNFLHGLLIL